jgi:hypothetical protein
VEIQQEKRKAIQRTITEQRTRARPSLFSLDMDGSGSDGPYVGGRWEGKAGEREEEKREGGGRRREKGEGEESQPEDHTEDHHRTKKRARPSLFSLDMDGSGSDGA